MFFVLFLGWAAFAPMDAAAYAPGQLQVSGQRQSVQHRDGGIVSAIHVREGQKVRAGDVLIELSGSDVRAEESTLAAQMINLLVQQARLEAEQQGLSQVAWPTTFGEVNAAPDQVAQAIAVQSAEFRARRSLLSAQQQVLIEQAQELVQTAGGYRAQMASSTEQERLITEELDSLRPVAEKGFVSKSRIRALERAKADLAGQGGQYRASVAEARLAGDGNRLREIEADKAYRESATTDLKEVTASIDELAPKYRAARDQLDRLKIRAPVSGAVVGLDVFTVGGVIAAGQKLMDVVPDKAELVVAARVSPTDIDDIAVGDNAELRFNGLHDPQPADPQRPHHPAVGRRDDRREDRSELLYRGAPDWPGRDAKAQGRARPAFRAPVRSPGRSDHPDPQADRAAICVRTLVQCLEQERRRALIGVDRVRNGLNGRRR